MQYVSKFINTDRLSRVPFMESGPATGIPVIFLHGVTDSHRSFELVFPHLGDDIRAIAITQRGHGGLAAPDAEFTPHDLSADLRSLMRTMGITSAVIVGHSMGSFAAQRFAIDHPEMVRGLVLIGSFTTCAHNEGVKEFVRSAVEPLKDPITREFAAEFQRSTFAKPIPEWFFESAVTDSMRVPASVWKAACRSMIEADHTAELDSICAKTLLIWGDQDEYFGRDEQDKLLSRIAGSELLVYEGVGHTPPWEAPERTANDIGRFARKLAIREAESQYALTM